MDPHDKSTVLTPSEYRGVAPHREITERRLPCPSDVLEGRYSIERPIGAGGMGLVYAARHITLGTRVALKLLTPQLTASEEHVERFLREARSASAIEHPCIARISDFGHTESGGPFFVMEYLEGEDLRERLRREGPLPWDTIGPIAIQICGALHAAHQAGIIHRDIKPSNIFLVGEDGDVKVLDFGIAKLLDATNQQGDLTSTGSVMGTAGYLSPEAVQGLPVDHRADIYSTGVMLYQLASGVLPFTGQDTRELMTARLDTPVPPLPASVPRSVVEIIHRCLAREPRARYPDVRFLYEDILGTLPRSGPAAVRTAAAVSRARIHHASSTANLPPCRDDGTRRKPSRWPLRVALGLSVATALGVGVTQWPHHSSTVDTEYLASFGALPELILAPGIEMDEARIALGRRLFHDPRLSRAGDIACATCHPLDRYGAEGTPVASGHAHRTLGRNAPTVFNAAGHFAQGWTGTAASVEEQVRQPLFNPSEMANDPDAVIAMLREDPQYPEQFRRAFPEAGDPLDIDYLSTAIGAFERTLVTPARWDRFIGGDERALSAPERRGFNAFVEIGCVQCHAGTYVGGAQFQKLGLLRPWPNSKDRGRYEDTGLENDWMLFKVPGLRNVGRTGPYFHDGSVTSLERAVRMMAKHQLDRELADDETEDIVAFLGTLTGDLPESIQP